MTNKLEDEVRRIVASMDNEQHSQEQDVPDTTEQEKEPAETIHIHYFPDAIGILKEGENTAQVVDSVPVIPQKISFIPAYTICVFYLFLILSCIAFQFYMILNPPIATVTIIPKSRTVTLTGTLQLGRVLQPLTISQSQTIPTTGKGHQDAKQAQGAITFYNGLFTSQSVPAGILLTGNDGVEIITDQYATIPAANPPNLGYTIVSAHAFYSGSSGNIPAYDINQACCATAIKAVDTTSFTGGQEKRNFQTVAKADISSIATPLKTTVMQSMQGALQGQVQPPVTLLDECYATIIGHHIDGTPFDGQRDTRRYMRSNSQGAGVLFPSSILTSDQGHVSTDVKDDKGTYLCFKGLEQEGYTLKTRLGIVSYKILWSLPGRELDKIIISRLFELAEQDSDMADRVKAIFNGMKGQGEDEAKLLKRQIEQTRKQIDRLDFLLTDTSVGLDVETAQKYAKDLAELRPKLARLLKLQQTRPDLDPEETIANFYFVLSHLSTEFQKQSSDVQRQMMSKLVKRVIVNNLSPHLFYLYIIWQDGVATRPDVALLWRGIPLKDSQEWSKEDNALIRSYWPKGQQLEVLKLFPLSTWTSIRHQANAMGIYRSKELKSGRKKVNKYHETMTYADLETAMQFTQAGCLQDEHAVLFYGNLEEATLYNEEEGSAYICEIVNDLAATTGSGKISAYWPWSVEIVGFSSFTKDEEGLSRPSEHGWSETRTGDLAGSER